MIAPQEWYEYQKQYQKYGIDMQPQSERVPIKERRRKKKSFVNKNHILSIGSDYKVMLTLVLVCMLVLMMVIKSSIEILKWSSTIFSSKSKIFCFVTIENT